MEHQKHFTAAGTAIFTIECHDLLPCRIMAKDETLDGSAAKPVPWPHLVDRAGAAGVQYDVHPMAFAVHAEYINRPAAAIIDKDGVLRFLYQGTYWGDRPTVPELLKMMQTGNFHYDAPKRLKLPTKPTQ